MKMMSLVSHQAAQASKLIILPQPFRSWCYRLVPPPSLAVSSLSFSSISKQIYICLEYIVKTFIMGNQSIYILHVDAFYFPSLSFSLASSISLSTASLYPQSLSSCFLQSVFCFASKLFTLWVYHIRNLWYLIFCTWFITLNMVSRSIHFSTSFSNVSSFVTE